MTRVRDLIQDALQELGVLDPSESIDAGAAASGLRKLNQMIEAWNIDDLMIYTVDRQTFPLVVNKQFYTIGVGGDFNTVYPVRPGQIDMVSVLIGSPSVEIPIKIDNDEEWRDNVVKQVNSTFPLEVWANGNYPLNTLAFWPIPQQVNQVVFYIWGQTTAFADVNATVVLPQGYEEAIVPNLAVRLAPQYQIQPQPATAALAAESKARIKRMNWEPTYRSADSVLMGNGTSRDMWHRSRGYVLD